MGERAQPNRRRCLQVGCNPLLIGAAAADAHRAETGHRTAAWPVRSAEGRRRAKVRNQTGYYDKYNVGAKAHRPGRGSGGDEYAFGEWDGLG